jgi:hypothetical protein
VLAAFAAALAAAPAAAQERPDTPPWTEPAPRPGAPKLVREPRVPLAWNRWYHVPELEKAARDLAAAFPDLVEVRTIGKSVEGRDLTTIVLTDRATGPDTSKTAFWVDGNIHGNEVQGSETCLYLVWWLCENRSLPRVDELLRRVAFYVTPTINPDGRARWLDTPGTMHSSRGGSRPVDNDRDGLFDEDGPDDLDGDGEILEMRVESPDGDLKPDPEDPRLMVRCDPGERGKWRMIGIEGRDDDGDGRFNEDGPGGYDPNRDWPTAWRPPAEQGGAGPYPCSLPETRAVVDFLSSHPNVAGFQSFHNAGGMILRSPGAQAFGAVPEPDDRVMRAIAARGEEQLPFYRSMVIWKDLYQVYGGSVDFAYGGLGILSFTNELWNPDQYRQRARSGRGEGSREERRERERERLRFDDDLEMSARWAAWKPFEHPQLGRVELGGWRRNTGRVPPPFMTEEMLHRNAMFVVYHASQMPRVTGATDLAFTDHGGGVRDVDVTFRNEGMIPTRSAWAADHRIGAPDRVTFEADGLVVLASGVVDPATGRVDAPEIRRPADLRLPRGIGGDSAVRVRFVVRGSGSAKVTYRSEKGGSATTTVEIR